MSPGGSVMNSRLLGSALSALLWSAVAQAASKPEHAAAAVTPSGLPSRSLFGTLSEPYPEVSEESARLFLSRNAARFQLDPSLADLTLTASLSSPLGRHFVFRQDYRGVPIYGAEVKVHFNSAG